MKISAQFKGALENMRSDRPHSMFICHVLQKLYGHGSPAQAVIERRLHPEATYGCWLTAHYPDLAKQYKVPGAANEARVQWLTALVAEFAAKGQ